MIAAGGRPDTADTAGLVCVLRSVTLNSVQFALFVSSFCTIPVCPLFRSGRGLWSNQSAAPSLHFRVDVMHYRNRNSNQSIDLINQSCIRLRILMKHHCTTACPVPYIVQLPSVKLLL